MIIILQLSSSTHFMCSTMFWSKVAFSHITIWAAPSEFGTYRLCEQRRFRRVCASTQSHQNLRCSLIQAVRKEEPSDGKPDPWPLWMAGHAQLKFVMTECSKTQIRLTRPILSWQGSELKAVISSADTLKYEICHERTCLRVFASMWDSNRPALPQRLVRFLKVWI